MAAPVVSVNPSAASMSPGDQIDVTVNAFDPDSASGSAVFPVTDAQGNTTEAAIDLLMNDPLTFGPASNPDNLAITIQQISASDTDAVYRITAS